MIFRTTLVLSLVALFTAACTSGAGRRIRGGYCSLTKNPLKMDLEEKEATKVTFEKSNDPKDESFLPQGTFVFNGADYRFVDTRGDNNGTKESTENDIVIQLTVTPYKSEKFVTNKNCARGLKDNMIVDLPAVEAITRMDVPKEGSSQKTLIATRVFSGQFTGRDIEREFLPGVADKEFSSPKDIFEDTSNPDNTFALAKDYQFYKRKGKIAVGKGRYELRTHYIIDKSVDVYVTSYYRLCQAPSDEEKAGKTDEEIQAMTRVYENCLEQLPFADDSQEEP